MSDDEYNALGLKMVEVFGDKLVDHEVQPRVAQFQAKLAQWVMNCEKDPIVKEP